jgi:hypothetical protein
MGQSLGYPVDPASQDVHLEGADLKAPIRVQVPPYSRTPLQLLYLQDISPSTSSELLSSVSNHLSGLFSSVRSTFAYSSFAVATFGDSVTNAFTFGQSIAPAITLGASPLSQNPLAALASAAQSTTLGWSPNTRHLVVVVTSAEFVSVAGLKEILLARNVVPVFVVSSTQSGSYQQLVDSLGFGHVYTFSSWSGVSTAVQNAVIQSAQTIPAIVSDASVSISPR